MRCLWLYVHSCQYQLNKLYKIRSNIIDPKLALLIDLDTPKINPAIGSGLAVTHMQGVEKYVDDVFRSAAKGFPEGLSYIKSVRCTPLEECAFATKKKGTKQSYDVARSDLYLMKYYFRYKGEDLDPRFIYLPFVSDAGSIVISGSRFNISPILSDRVVSVGVSNIFVRLLRDRLTFERISQHYLIDGKRETVQVGWASIYHKNQKMKKLKAIVKANCVLMLYLFCKYGFAETFLKFGGCKPIIGGIEITKTVYPDSEWVICSSNQIKPKGVGRLFYEATNVRIAIKSSELTPMVRNMVGGFFYVADHFPARVLPEYIGGAHERRMWMVLLGHIVFSGTINEGKLYDDIEDHLTSLDEYLDGLVIEKLKDIGINSTDIWQLFALVAERFNDWLLVAADKVSSMYDKELSINYYVLYEITSAIFNLYFKLKAASKKELTSKEIVGLMNLTLRPGLIYGITKNHGEISTATSSGDNKAFKMTASLVPQSGSNRLSNRKGPAVLDNPAQRLHVSVAEIGGYSNLPKSAPDGRSRLNPHSRTNDKGVVLRNPERVEMLDAVQELIRRN